MPGSSGSAPHHVAARHPCNFYVPSTPPLLTLRLLLNLLPGSRLGTAAERRRAASVALPRLDLCPAVMLMRPVVLIIEPRREVAAALEEVVASARYQPIVRPYIDGVDGLGVVVSAIIVRIAFDGISEPGYRALERIRIRPPVVAIVWNDKEHDEATRLGCEVILRAPEEIGQLCTALARLVHA
jgi:hypothetical protein